MQIDNKLTSTGTGDGRGNQSGRGTDAGDQSAKDGGRPAAKPLGGYDPSARVSLSAEALLFLGRTRRSSEKYPALTQEEWANRLSPELASREYQAFGKYGDTGDHRAYYRAFIEYYDNLRPEDQNSLRYFGTRDAAIAGFRSVQYSDESGEDSGATFQTLVSVLLDTDKPQSELTGAMETAGSVSGDMFGWDTGTIVYEDVSQSRGALSEIEKFYRESF